MAGKRSPATRTKTAKAKNMISKAKSKAAKLSAKGNAQLGTGKIVYGDSPKKGAKLINKGTSNVKRSKQITRTLKGPKKLKKKA